MIGRLRGVLAVKQPPYLMIEVQGVGYDLEASLTTFQNLPGVGEEITLYTHFAVRDDAHALYGFASLTERVMFRNLIKVSGIGAKLALLILSGMTVDAFASCVQEGNAVALTRLPGVGKKTAERLIVEMRDRIANMDLTDSNRSAQRSDGIATPVTSNPLEDAVSALTALGYKPVDAVRMVNALNTEELSSEQIIRLALQAAVRK
ncbi:MAG: Holliday junction branch migration protein RuvA [Candidatus Competibacteraceae bacterium]|jgi:Holliday junction DNA helicase RuvA|nr:Holliday junction branch migration protein RuvA [Candidatus Competibacteraceae bacterium]